MEKTLIEMSELLDHLIMSTKVMLRTLSMLRDTVDSVAEKVEVSPDREELIETISRLAVQKKALEDKIEDMSSTITKTMFGPGGIPA
jgi:hypothetical protein